MKSNRYILLIVSGLVMVFLLGGGLLVRVGAADSSFRQSVLFAEVLSLVLENYVDPVEADGLLEGAYEGMLGGLDPNGAYLTADEVAAWKADRAENPVGPGISVLKSGRILQVVAVDPASSAGEAGIRVGDHVRRLDEWMARDLSLIQARRLLEGPSGTTVRLDLVHPDDGYRREDGIELLRRPRHGRSYNLEVERGIAVLRLSDVQPSVIGALASELDDVRSRGVTQLLLDLRNLADGDPRQVAEIAALFGGPTTMQLRDPSGRLLETVRSAADRQPWSGSVSVLVNGATAGAGEALAALVQSDSAVKVFGEPTYGLGAEVRLYDLENGAALLVPSSVWETELGKSWNVDGIQPDEVVRGDGENYAEVSASQLSRVIELLEQQLAATQDEAA